MRSSIGSGTGLAPVVRNTAGCNEFARGVPRRHEENFVHLVRGSAFAGVHPRKHHLLLTIKAKKPIRSVRVLKTEQVSKNRWHLEVKIETEKDIDTELLGWLREAYELCLQTPGMKLAG